MRRRRLVTLVLAILAGVGLAAEISPTLAQDGSPPAQAPPGHWNVLVGGNVGRNSLSPEFGPTAPRLLWAGGTPTLYVHQAVIEGNIVVSDRTQSHSDLANGSLIEARSLISGKLLWD